jgi:hypothetical protein
MNFIDYEVKDQWISRTLQKDSLLKLEVISWDTFNLMTGLHINLKNRINQKIRIRRESGHVYVSDHNWIQGEKYRQNKIIAVCSYINAEGEALLNSSRLNIFTSVKPLDWVIV